MTEEEALKELVRQLNDAGLMASTPGYISVLQGIILSLVACYRRDTKELMVQLEAKDDYWRKAFQRFGDTVSKAIQLEE